MNAATVMESKTFDREEALHLTRIYVDAIRDSIFPLLDRLEKESYDWAKDFAKQYPSRRIIGTECPEHAPQITCRGYVSCDFDFLETEFIITSIMGLLHLAEKFIRNFLRAKIGDEYDDNWQWHDLLAKLEDFEINVGAFDRYATLAGILNHDRAQALDRLQEEMPEFFYQKHPVFTAIEPAGIKMSPALFDRFADEVLKFWGEVVG
jgi:hypothetical protein